MIGHLVHWLANTRASNLIQSVSWLIPAVQTAHILAISAVISAVALIYLRSLGFVLRRLPRGEVARRFLPIVWYGVLVLLVTGLILIIGEPDRELLNSMFQIKMILLGVALALTALFQRPLRADSLYWDRTATRRAGAVMLAVFSIAVWIGIVFAGRWIAYVAPS